LRCSLRYSYILFINGNLLNESTRAGITPHSAAWWSVRTFPSSEWNIENFPWK
jgi:hypothetical protein